MRMVKDKKPYDYFGEIKFPADYPKTPQLADVAGLLKGEVNDGD
jgi:hypothetical protein